MEIRLKAEPDNRRVLIVDAGNVGCFSTIAKPGLSFDVFDSISNQQVLTSTRWAESWWASFMGRKEDRISNGETVVARVQYYALGLRRRAILTTGEGSLPRHFRKFSLLGMEWEYNHEGLRVANVDETVAMPVIGLASYWLIRRLVDEERQSNDAPS